MPNSRTIVRQLSLQSERRSDASQAGRELIHETAALIQEQTRRYLAAPRLTKRILTEQEPIVDRYILVIDGKLLTRPRKWIRELLTTLEAATLVKITIEPSEDGPQLHLYGRWSDVQLAELIIQRTLLLVTQAATYAYRAQQREASGHKRRRQKAHSGRPRQRWLELYVTYLRMTLGHVYEQLAREHGVEALRSVVHSLEHVILPGNDTQLPARKAVAASGR